MDWEQREKIIAELQAAVPSNGDASFFNRQAELRALLGRLCAPPMCATMVVGPSDCGKSALLKQLETIWMSNRELAATSPVFYFDVRKQVWSTPQDAAAHVRECFSSWMDLLKQWVERVKQGLSGITVRTPGKYATAAIALESVCEAFQPGKASDLDLVKSMEALCQVIERTEVPYPIFIFDEADRLKAWAKEDLEKFSGFFKALVKQDRRVYLLISSSDDFFRAWLNDMFTPAQWEPFGVGLLSQVEARGFFEGYSMILAAGRTPPPPFQECDWKHVYAVCGGSPMLLNRCARSAALNGISWEQAAMALMMNSLSIVQAGLAATKATKGFCGKNYELICTQIVRRGLIGLKAVQAEIYQGDKVACREEVAAMVSGSFIHLRYVTPETCYGDVSLADAGDEFELVMARSPADRAAMREELGLGLEWDEE